LQKVISVDEKKLEVVSQPQPSKNPKDLTIFLGKTKWHAKCLRHLVDVVHHLYKIMKNGTYFRWKDPKQRILNSLNLMLTNATVLRKPDWRKEFQVHVDASNVVVRVVLTQCLKGDLMFSIYCASRWLDNAEKNYATMEREALGLIYVVRKYQN